MSLAVFHPATARWFTRTFGEPSEPQLRGWPAIVAKQNTLIAAPTGSGKTLAAFMSAIDELVQQGLRGELRDETQVVYVSPLKALSNDIERNLREPLAGIAAELRELGLPEVEIRVAVRTGDTKASDRTRSAKRPPHILVTTPESLYILLTSESGRRGLASARTLIVDEIHALVPNKRGSHLALTMERLEELAGRPLTRIGLSATQDPVTDVAKFLIGERCDPGASAAPPAIGGANLGRFTGEAGSAGAAHEARALPGQGTCHIIDCGARRQIDLALELPGSALEPVMSAEVWDELYERLADLIREHRTTLVFVNTRRLAERVARQLAERLGEGRVTSHHGSLSREHRLLAEQRLKAGELSALVCTASLELGIDVGAVELVCQLGSTRSISALMQRVGRSGHFRSGVPKGRLFPLSRDELCDSAALLDAVAARELDRVQIPAAPLDILAQQIVAMAACEALSEGALYALVRRAYPYRELPRERFEAVLQMLEQGFSTARGRRGALVHRDRVNGRLRGRKGARLLAMTSGGAIPDNADYTVVLDPASIMVGTVNEDFAIESMQGDIFQLGNMSYRILRVDRGTVRVEDARGSPPTIPFWLGEAPSRSRELSVRVSALRSEAERVLGEGDPSTLARELESRGLAPAASEQIAEYLGAAKVALGVLPTRERIVVERFFDEAGGMQLVLHSPLGSRLNRALGLSLRKRFCRSFNFELQAAATEDAIVLSLGPTHSFPLEDLRGFLRASTVRQVLTQALLDAPMFETRWRWNCGRALAVPRFRNGKKTPAYLQRMLAADLLTTAFPDQQACAENLRGEREIPDHPLVQQTIDDCLHEAMDVAALETLLADVEEGRIELVFRDLTEPSPFAAEILNARPYAFLDDAPLEERRTQAVMSRRLLDAKAAQELGALDAEAIARVRAEAWPAADLPDELHDALCLLGCVTEPELQALGAEHFEPLASERRAARLERGTAPVLFVAAERLVHVRAVFPEGRLAPAIEPPASERDVSVDRELALRELVRSRLDASGPQTAAALARVLGVAIDELDGALHALEAEGAILRGRFTPGTSELEWCERRLLARIHRYTLDRLRKEIEPVSQQDFLRFLLAHQRVSQGEQASGPSGLLATLEQLSGVEAPAASWETDLLPARVQGYDPSWLDQLCLSGEVAWARLSAPVSGTGARPLRVTPIALLPRSALPLQVALRAATEPASEPTLGANAQRVRDALLARGACFATDLEPSTQLLPSQLQDALAELVAAGVATSDAYGGLRALLMPSRLRTSGRRGGLRVGVGGGTVSAAQRVPAAKRTAGTHARGLSAGRWVLVPKAPAATELDDAALQAVARTLLARYGVVFRKLLERETVPPWRLLSRALRRMEASGELRGGRFVEGFSGEQFALPSAVERLRQIRRCEPSERWVALSAADPLNLFGTTLPGERVPALSKNRLLLRDGALVASLEKNQVRFFASELSPEARWNGELALRKRQIPVTLRPYVQA